MGRWGKSRLIPVHVKIYLVCMYAETGVGGHTAMRKKTMQLRENPLVYPRYPKNANTSLAIMTPSFGITSRV